MRIFNKKTLWCQIQDASLISAALSGLSMVGSSFLFDTSKTPLFVSGTIMTMSLISIIESGRIEHKKENNSEEFIDTESVQVYRVMPQDEFEEKEENDLFHMIQPAYKKEGNLISVDFEKINELKTKKLIYKNRSN